jgi:hypothetical protein
MKPTEMLKKQHREVKSLFKQIEKAEEGDARRRLLQEIARHLEAHTKIEEEFFYPAVRELGTKKAEEMIGEAYEEHHVVDLVLKEFPRLDVEDERFHAKMTVLQELVEHHVEEEEKEMFKMADRLPKEQQAELVEKMQRRFQQLMGGKERQAA